LGRTIPLSIPHRLNSFQSNLILLQNEGRVLERNTFLKMMMNMPYKFDISILVLPWV
jgi:hypothetical protein